MGSEPTADVMGARLRPLAWLTLAVGILVVAGGVALLTLVEARSTHESSATLLIDQPRGLSLATDSGLIDKLGRLRFKYAGLVTTEEFAEPVADELDLEVRPVREALFSRVDPDSLLLQVGARHDDPELVRRIAATAAEAVVAYVEEEQDDADVPEDQRFVFRVVTGAVEGRPLPDPSDRYGVAAVVAGSLIALAGLAALLVLPRRR